VLQPEYRFGLAFLRRFHRRPAARDLCLHRGGLGDRGISDARIDRVDRLVGALLVRWQGIKVLMDARQSLARDELPLPLPSCTAAFCCSRDFCS
jgi:hypothetical protein